MLFQFWIAKPGTGTEAKKSTVSPKLNAVTTDAYQSSILVPPELLNRFTVQYAVFSNVGRALRH